MGRIVAASDFMMQRLKAVEKVIMRCIRVSSLAPRVTTSTTEMKQRPEAAAGRSKTQCCYNGLAHSKVRSDRRLALASGLSPRGKRMHDSTWRHSTACCLFRSPLTSVAASLPELVEQAHGVRVDNGVWLYLERWVLSWIHHRKHVTRSCSSETPAGLGTECPLSSAAQQREQWFAVWTAFFRSQLPPNKRPAEVRLVKVLARPLGKQMASQRTCRRQKTSGVLARPRPTCGSDLSKDISGNAEGILSCVCCRCSSLEKWYEPMASQFSLSSNAVLPNGLPIFFFFERHPGQSSRRKVRSVVVSSIWFWDSSLPSSCCHDDGVQKRVERIETRSPLLVLCTAPSERRSTRQHSSAPRQDVARRGYRPVGFASDLLPKSCDASQFRSSSPASRRARVLGGRSILQRRALNSSKCCGKKPIWEGVWPYLDPMDSVCSRTASMEWNVPGKYWPHGDTFFFLTRKEPATLPDGETFKPLHQC